MRTQLLPEPTDQPFIRLDLTRDEFDLIVALAYQHARIGPGIPARPPLHDNPPAEAILQAARTAGITAGEAAQRCDAKNWLV